MSPHRHAQAVLFWLMVGMSLATLTPALLLPAWIDYRAALHMRAGKRLLVDRLEREVTAQDRQIRHLHDDGAYNERILREELGIEVPGVRTIYVDPPRVDVGPYGRVAADTALRRIADDEGLFPAIGRTAEGAIETWPGGVRLFLDPPTRRWIALGSGSLLLGAVVLAGGSPRRPAVAGDLRTAPTP